MQDQNEEIKTHATACTNWKINLSQIIAITKTENLSDTNYEATKPQLR